MFRYDEKRKCLIKEKKTNITNTSVNNNYYKPDKMTFYRDKCPGSEIK